MIPTKPCSCLHSLSCPREILLVNKRYQQKHNFATSTAALTERAFSAVAVFIHITCNPTGSRKSEGSFILWPSCWFIFLTSKHLVLCADTQCRKIPENLAGLRGVCFYLVKHFSSGNSRNHFRKGHMVTAIPFPLLLSLKTYLEQFLLCNQNIIPIQAAAALWQWSHFHLLRVGMFTRGEIWTTLSGL